MIRAERSRAASPRMYPCDPDVPRAPGLYTYYVITSLLVVVLAITMVWFPFVQLITEINTIITKVVIYFNVEFLGYKNDCFLKTLEALFLSQPLLITISVVCMGYALYLASGDFLLFTACYLCNLPTSKEGEKVKVKALEVIQYLLNLTGKKRMEISKENPRKHYRSLHA